MGLDQYLTIRKSLVGDSRMPQDTKANYDAVISELAMSKVADKNFPFAEVKVSSIYWRKSNQIHKWFVDNVQQGKDDCDEYFVYPHQLIELRDLCKIALETKDADLLPPQGGFFFGSTDVDEYYWGDIERTIKELTRVIDALQIKPQKEKNRHVPTILYQASW